jgi:predicted dehydrogenase
MLRYNRLLEMAQRVIASGVLGEPLRFSLENYAEDERLPREHWFWDRAQSGGIFVEHAVHFFDLHRWWFGPGEVIAAHRETRPGTGQVDRVWCATRHGQALGQQYHSFDQPVRLDRADHRVVFTRGQLEVFGWIPLELRIAGIVDTDQREELLAICGGCNLEVEEQYLGEAQHCRGRGVEYVVTERIGLGRRLSEDKLLVYGDMLRAILEDQLLRLEQPDHSPRLRAEDAREAVVMAEQATRLAEEA